MSYKIKKAFARILAIVLTVMLIALGMSACSKSAENESDAVTATDTGIDLSELFTDRDLETGYDESEAETITLSDNATTSESRNVTIDGNNVTITDEGVYLLSGTLSNGQIIVNAEETDKVQLVLNGVSITSQTTAAIYVINADKVFITTTENSENTLSESGEFVADGDTNIDAVIFSKSDVTLNGLGTLTVSTEYGNGITSKDDLKLTSGTYDITVSGKGLEANDSIRIANGVYTIVSEDDSLHSNDYTTIVGGDFTLTSGDDGIHSDGTTTVSAGTVNIVKSYEGIEGTAIYITGGEISIVASDDGLNAAGGNDQSGYGTMMDEFAADENAIISISGGMLTVNAEGDGIDSNGSIEITGGETYVCGPTNNGNGALDYNGTAKITGGTIIALGSSGMAMNMSEATQGSILVNFNASYSNEEITVTDSDGNTIISFTSTKSFNSVMVSSPDLKKGETYTISIGETYQTVTLDDYIYGSGSGMGMGGGMGGMQDGFGSSPMRQ